MTRAGSSTWPMFRALVGVGLLCGALIVVVYQLTLPIIESNRADALHRAIFEAVPGAETTAAFTWTGDRFVRARDDALDGDRVFAAYGADGRFLGVAVEAAGMGYQDVIEVLYGYSPDQRAIVGMVVLQSRETPGLGDKIELDPGFVANFERLAVSPRIEAVKHGDKTEPHQIDSITGATISSAAIADILADSSETWAERIDARARDFSEN